MLLIFAFIFFITITQMPAKSIAASVGGGGSYCDEGSSKYCWTSLPYWKCLTDQGGIKCVNPQQE